MEDKFISKEIHSGIFIHRKIRSDNTQEYQIENQRYNTLDFFIDFTGSSGVAIIGSGALTLATEISPQMTTHLVSISTQEQYSLSTKFKLKLKPPPPEIARPLIDEEHKELRKSLRAVARELEGLSISTSSLGYISERLKGANFISPDFPPNESSIFSGVKYSSDIVIHWRRPRDIYGDDFTLFDEELDPHDIKQDQLSDYAFLGAVATVAERPELLKRLIQTDTVSPDGIYRVRFCKGGEWVTLTIDDYFPCYPQGTPIFSRTHGKAI